MRKIFLLILFFTLFSCVYAHKIAGMQLSVELIQDEKILIKGFNEQAKKDSAKLTKNPLLIITPKKFVNPELKTIVLGVKEDIFIHQLYWTAWQNNGVLQFREDIYCRDSDLFAYLYY